MKNHKKPGKQSGSPGAARALIKKDNRHRSTNDSPYDRGMKRAIGRGNSRR